MTRWNKKDLTGRLIKKMAQEKGADQWEVIEVSCDFTFRKTIVERILEIRRT